MWLIVILIGYMAGIFLLSSIPDTGDTGHVMASVSPTIQNVLHIPVYGFLALLWIFTLRTRGFPENKSVWAAILLSSAYGGLMELYQTWVPGRFPSVMDFFVNVAGILFFVWIYRASRQLSAFSYQQERDDG